MGYSSQFIVLIRKEMKEQMRTSRLLIILAVFIFFGIASPLAARFMPEIIDSIAKEQNIVIQMPEGKWQDAAAQFIKNISQMGVFILIILGMGAVAKEKETGTAAFMLVKPVSRDLFIISKFITSVLTIVFSILIGVITMLVYTRLFFGEFEITLFVIIAAVLCLYLSVIQAITLFFSTLMKSQIPAGVLAFITTLALGGLSLLGNAGIWSPSHLIAESNAIVAGAMVNWQPFMIAILLIISLLLSGIYYFRKWE